MMLLALGLAFTGIALSSSPAFAAAVPDGTCTTDPQFDIPPSGGNGLITTIINQVDTILSSIAATMYNNIIMDAGFVQVAQAVVTLYLTVYGILFTFGMVNITLFDFVIRMIKIGIIALLISPMSWAFFSSNVVFFFNDGTNSLINQVTSLASNIPNVNPNAPFAVLDNVIAQAVSAKMMVTILAIFFTGPYGVIFGLLILMAMGSFFKALMMALWVYLMALVLKTLLFGIAPIFFVCLLFNRTRHLFDGWLNQVLNASLQPILLFTFFAFFAVLIQACIGNLLVRPVCWTEWSESVRGSPFAEHYWRFATRGPSGFEPYGDIWSFGGAQNGGEIFPIDIMTVLIFLILAELAGRFNHIVVEIARELAAASTSLAMGSESISDWFSKQGRGTAAGAARSMAGRGGRPAPGVGGRASGARGGGPTGTASGGAGNAPPGGGAAAPSVNPFAPGRGSGTRGPAPGM